MKKKIALFLVAAMTISTLVACGNNAEEAPAAATEEAAPAEDRKSLPLKKNRGGRGGTGGR